MCGLVGSERGTDRLAGVLLIRAGPKNRYVGDMALSCSGCPLSLKTPNMGNPG